MMPNKTPIPTTPLPAIPLVDIGNNGPVALFESELARADEIVRLGREQYGPAVVGFLDHVSKHWAAFARNPHIDEIQYMARQMPPGIWFMNLCLEWACTNGVMDDPTAPGMRLLHKPRHHCRCCCRHNLHLRHIQEHFLPLLLLPHLHSREEQ